jgi:hypothetical protein
MIELNAAARFEDHPEALSRSLHTALHAGDRQAETVRRRRLRHPGEIGDLESLHVGSGKLLHQRVEAGGELSPRRAGTRSVRLDDLRRDVPNLGQAIRGHLATVGGAVVVSDRVSRRPVDPRVHAIAVAKRGKTSVDLEEHALDDVVHICGVAHTTTYEPAHIGVELMPQPLGIAGDRADVSASA